MAEMVVSIMIALALMGVGSLLLIFLIAGAFVAVQMIKEWYQNRKKKRNG